MSGTGSPDFFYREAQRLGYVARSAFKLLQIQKQYKLITPGSSVLDLGCAPGAWLQVACQNLGPLTKGGVVVGIDVKKVKVPQHNCDSRVQTVCADIMNFPRDRIRALSPQICVPRFLESLPRIPPISFELGMRVLDIAVGRGASAQMEGYMEGLATCSNEEDDNGVLQKGGHLIH